MRTITVYYDNIRTKVEIENNTLTVPEGIKRLDCRNNQLTSLTVPEGIERLDCRNNSNI